MTLTEFLAARLDEWAAAAKAATPGPWRASGEDILSGTDDPHWAGARAASASDGADAAHIILSDPARVLREVEAGRKILARYERALAVQPALVSYTRGQDDGYTEACRDAVADLAAVWSDHPDYDEAWRP